MTVNPDSLSWDCQHHWDHQSMCKSHSQIIFQCLHLQALSFLFRGCPYFSALDLILLLLFRIMILATVFLTLLTFKIIFSPFFPTSYCTSLYFLEQKSNKPYLCPQSPIYFLLTSLKLTCSRFLRGSYFFQENLWLTHCIAHGYLSSSWAAGNASWCTLYAWLPVCHTLCSFLQWCCSFSVFQCWDASVFSCESFPLFLLHSLFWWFHPVSFL